VGRFAVTVDLHRVSSIAVVPGTSCCSSLLCFCLMHCGSKVFSSVLSRVDWLEEPSHLQHRIEPGA
jgi:hypothetical protein